MTLVVDWSTGAILDLHFANTKPNDTKIGWWVLRRNVGPLSTIMANKGYHWGALTTMLRNKKCPSSNQTARIDSFD